MASIAPRRAFAGERRATSQSAKVCQRHIVVTVKLVPETNADKRIDRQTPRQVRNSAQTVLNPFDEYAIKAIRKSKNIGRRIQDDLDDQRRILAATIIAPTAQDQKQRRAPGGAAPVPPWDG